jgi:hypothetical protein
MPGNVLYVSVLVYNPSDPNTIEMRLGWFRPLLESRIPLVLFIDARYQEALEAVEWFSEGIHPDVRMIPWELDDSETWRLCREYSPLQLPESRNGAKDTEFFMTLMNAKTELVAAAAGLEMEWPFVAFLDAGIAKIFKDVEGSFRRLRDLEIRRGFSGMLLPGCWEPAGVRMDVLAGKICWMFCGGFFVIPRGEVMGVEKVARMALREFLERGRLTWEVNVWVWMRELPGAPVMRWFSADHNDRMTIVPSEYRAAEL